MTKRVGILSLILAAGMAVLQPTAALAQDWRDHDVNVRDHGPRQEERVYREPERPDFQAREDHDFRDRVLNNDGRARYTEVRRYNGDFGPAHPYICR
jgi:hypothetical protein